MLKYQRLIVLLSALILGIGACNPEVPDPISPESLPENVENSNQVAGNQSVFASAKSKRFLSQSFLSRTGSILGNNTNAPASQASAPAMPSAPPSAAPTVAPSAAPTTAPGAMDFGFGYAMPYSGGNEFNSYIPVQAEESIFPGSRSSDLLEVYQELIRPILKEWDLQARLLESRGNTAHTSPYHQNIEYIYVPGLNGDQAIQLQPAWIFRFASTPRKETLTVYVMEKETRVYRVIWGEPHLDLSKVKITVPQAQAIARKAIADRRVNPGYPVYPESQAHLGDATILYEVPEGPNWTVSLAQQGSQLVYYLGYSYQEALDKPGELAIVPTPQPSMQSDFIIAQAEPTASSSIEATPSVTPSAEINPSSEPSVEATPSWEPSIEPTYTPMPTPTSLPYPECLPDWAQYIYINASISIDAVSGKILNLTRPVRYHNIYGYYDSTCYTSDN